VFCKVPDDVIPVSVFCQHNKVKNATGFQKHLSGRLHSSWPVASRSSSTRSVSSTRRVTSLLPSVLFPSSAERNDSELPAELTSRRLVETAATPRSSGWPAHGGLGSMGNCLFFQGADDLSLLNESEGGSLPGEPPPPYQVSFPRGSS